MQNMEVENAMLKNELNVMNREVAELLDRLRKTEDGNDVDSTGTFVFSLVFFLHGLWFSVSLKGLEFIYVYFIMAFLPRIDWSLCVLYLCLASINI